MESRVLKYMCLCPTEEEAKKQFHNFAKRMHPDAGGSNEEFQILNEEYDYVIAHMKEKQTTPSTVNSAEECYNKKSDEIREKIRSILDRYGITFEVIPFNTDSQEEVSLPVKGVVILEDAPIKQVLNIEQEIFAACDPLTVKVKFKYGRRKPHNIFTYKEYNITCIDFTNDDWNIAKDVIDKRRNAGQVQKPLSDNQKKWERYFLRRTSVVDVLPIEKTAALIPVII